MYRTHPPTRSYHSNTGPHQPASRGVWLLLGLGCLYGGCTEMTTAKPYQRPLEPIADRLRRTYPDLASGRFVIVADFESVDQGAIFRLSPPTAAGYVAIVTEKAKPETGAGALKVRLTTTDQALVIEDTDQGPWTLPRDWRRFHLLLFSVWSPRAMHGMTFTARSGPGQTIAYQRDDLVLQEGWNLIRLDIGEMRDHIDIADVRYLQIGFQRLDRPIEFYLDDIVLVDNSADVLATPDAQPGELYCRTEGRRIRVGAVNAFEVVFAQGRIVQWFDLRHDPDRIRNLTGRGPLGPMPIPLPPDAAVAEREIDLQTLALDEPAAEILQGIVEANAIRVVVWGRWRFGSPQAASSDPTADRYCEWTYTVYPTGSIYLEFAARFAKDETTPSSQYGYALAWSADDGFRMARTDVAPAKPTEPVGLVLYRQRLQQPDLVFGFHRNDTAPNVLPITLQGEPRVGVIYSSAATTPTTNWAALIGLFPDTHEGQIDPLAILHDYVDRTHLTVIAGTPIQTDDGDLDNDGFNESRGHYTFEPDGRVVKLRIDGREHPCFAPAFKIIGVADDLVWAYVDGLELRPIVRNDQGDAIFQLPQIIDREVLLEVVTRPRDAAAAITPVPSKP
jgi:hypothetical protein